MTDNYDGTVTVPRPYDGTFTAPDPNLIAVWDLDDQTRAYVLRDVDAPAPDHDGIGYVLRNDGSSWTDVLVAGDYADTGADTIRDAVTAAWSRFGDHELIGRYLRAFYDVVSYDYSSSIDRGATYYGVVTRDQIDAWGCDPDGTAAGALETYRQYVDGDVFGVIVVNTATGAEDSCWGIYDTSPNLDHVRATAVDIAPIGVQS